MFIFSHAQQLTKGIDISGLKPRGVRGSYENQSFYADFLHCFKIPTHAHTHTHTHTLLNWVWTLSLLVGVLSPVYL